MFVISDVEIYQVISPAAYSSMLDTAAVKDKWRDNPIDKDTYELYLFAEMCEKNNTSRNKFNIELSALPNS